MIDRIKSINDELKNFLSMEADLVAYRTILSCMDSLETYKIILEKRESIKGK